MNTLLPNEESIALARIPSWPKDRPASLSFPKGASLHSIWTGMGHCRQTDAAPGCRSKKGAAHTG
jgi:hypothetical protein